MPQLPFTRRSRRVIESTPFTDAVHKTGPPNIPGIVQCALFDLGGEGVAYHDTDAVNNGSAKLNLDPSHQKAHASPYIWHFRKDEGVDISFVKDGADLSHTNLVSPHINQLYIGWTENGEWCNYTVNVTRPGTYRIKCLNAYQPNTVTFDLNGKLAATCHLPVPTASFHHWNLAEIGTIQFPEAGLQLLTFHYGSGHRKVPGTRCIAALRASYPKSTSGGTFSRYQLERSLGS